MQKKRRLVVLSDLWGWERADWLTYYLDQLQGVYDITCYDSCSLGNVSTTDRNEATLHAQFMDGGLETAVSRLLELESAIASQDNRPVDVLAFSIGGTIAWKACLSGLEAHRIFALSSTRLRYETVLPAAGIYLYYGETDPYKPDEVWMRQMNLSCRIFPETGHLLYRESNFASQVCRDILNGV
jgi:pimeloyl-ACP methyl ester carboxylesterase